MEDELIHLHMILFIYEGTWGSWGMVHAAVDALSTESQQGSLLATVGSWSLAIEAFCPCSSAKQLPSPRRHLDL